MTEQYAKEAAFKQTALIISYEDAAQGGRSWEETVGAKDINLDDDDYERQTSQIIDRAKRLEVFQMSEIMKSGVNFSSVYKDVYKRSHDTNLDRLIAVRDGYRAKVKQAEATGKKVTKRQLDILAKTEADVLNAEKQYSDFVDNAAKSVKGIFDRVLPYGKGSDVVLDFHRLVQAVAYGQRSVIGQLHQKYRNNQMLNSIFVDNPEGAVEPGEGVDAAVAPTEGVEGAVAPIEGVDAGTEEPAPFNVTAVISEFDYSQLTPDQKFDVMTNGPLANWMFKVVTPEIWDGLSVQRKAAIVRQAIKDPIVSGEIVGDLVTSAQDTGKYLPAEGEYAVYGDRQNTVEGSLTQGVDQFTYRKL